MDPKTTERVGRNRRLRLPRQQPQKYLVESPPSTPKSSQKKKKSKKETSSGEYWLVKQILDEKIAHGDTLYLIDWEDNTKTGESYTPTWEPYDNVNTKAINEWIARARQEKGNQKESRRTRERRQESPSSFDPYLSSQPIHTAKRQRTSRPSEVSSSSQPPAKRPRRAGTAETARFQSVSQEAVNLEGNSREVKDSYEDKQSQRAGNEHIQVEIPIDQEFDREAYARVTVVSSQPSQPSQATQPSHISQLSRSSDNPISSYFKTPTRHSFIWDEEDDGLPIVPDSQDLAGSSSYKPTETPTPKTGGATRPSTTASTEADAATWRSSSSHLASAGTDYRHPELSRYSYRASDAENEFEPSSSQVRRSLQRSDSRRYLSTPVDESQEGQLHQSSVAESAEDLILSSGTGFRSQASIITGSSQLPTSLENPLIGRTSSQEVPGILSQVQVCQQSSPEVDESPRFRLQAQSPAASQEESSSRIADLDLTQGSNVDETLHNRQLETESPPPKSAAQTPHSVFTFEESPQSAQVQSTSLPTFTQDSQKFLENKGSFAVSRDASPQVPAVGELGSVDVSVQKPQDQTPSADRSTSLSSPKRQSRLLEVSESILPSIEHTRETVSPFLLRPPPSSNAIMADKPMTEMSTAERLRYARQAAAEDMMARQRAARTASVIPHTPPPPAPPAINQMLPVRETAPEPVPTSTPSPKASPDQEVPATSLHILPLGENVHVVPLPMVALARSIYEQEITNYRPHRRAFLNDDDIDTQIVAEIDSMIDRLEKICDHQDLILKDSATQQMDSDHRQARWAENISTKCIFLAALLDSLQSSAAHVLVLARPGRMIDILEALFRTHGYVYTRPDQYASNSEQGTYKISLLPTNAAKEHYELQPASLVVVFDSTFVPSSYVESIRKNPARIGHIAPRVHLVVTHSIEHLELCFPDNMNELDRKTMLVNSLLHVRAEMGVLEGEDVSPVAAAKAIAGFLIDEASAEWPLPPMPSIEGIEPVSPTPIESSEAQPSGSTTQSYDISSTSHQPAFKRPLLDREGSESESSKRQRLTPAGDTSNSGGHVSQGNETIMDTSGDQSDLDRERAATIVIKADSLDTASTDQISSLLQKISDLEEQLRNKEVAESSLRQINQHLEARVQDYEKSVARIQPKYQEALNDRGQAHHEIEKSIACETSIRQKLDARTSDLARVKEEKALADAALLDARATLASSSIPEIAEVQKLKDELNAAKAENAKLQKKITVNFGDMEYMRNNYQKASSAAAEMRTELDELKNVNETLSRKASENAVEIHRIQSSADTKEYLDTIEALEREKSMLEWQLEKRNEELKGLLNGRRATRGSSVPKSPRMGTMSPGQSSRPMSRVIGGVGSRGTSPAPGGMEGQFRGPGTFGEALFPTQASNRFGNHLT